MFVEDSAADRQTLRLITATPPGFPRSAIGARITASRTDERVYQYLDALTVEGVAIWLSIDAPATRDGTAEWRDWVRRLFDRRPTGIRLVEIVFNRQPADLQRLVLEIAASESRAAGPRIRVAASGVDRAAADRLIEQLSPELSPYLDTLALDEDLPAIGAHLAAARRHVSGVDGVRRAGAADPARIVRDALAALGTSTIATAWRVSDGAMSDALVALLPAADLLLHDVEEIAAPSIGLTVSAEDPATSAGIRPRVLMDQDTLSTYLVYDGGLPGVRLRTALRIPVASAPAVFDLLGNTRVAATEYARDEATLRTTLSFPLTGGPVLANFSSDTGDVFAERSGVSAVRALSVDEIIARHRQYQTRLDGLVRNYRAHVRMEQHFRPSLTDPGYDVVTENQYFVEGASVEWEEQSFSVNGSKWGSDRPAFPLLQAEKVLSLPFDLRLNQDYRYELAGSERIGDLECFRVRFEPLSETNSLYRGTVWIDGRSFAKVRIQAVQTRTSAPIVSNEETHHYTAVSELEGSPVFLLTRHAARQIVLIAGRNLLLEKASSFTDFTVNDESFREARSAAHTGERIMYRDTDQGLRYLLKQGNQRVVSERSTAHAKAMAIGVLVDPSFAFPLPIFGINYLDFEVRGRSDTQFALLFGGVLAAGNLQRPKLAGTPLDASVDFFGIAAPVSDRLHTPTGEREGERVLSWPLSTGLNLGWQYTAFQKATFQYQFRFDPFVRDRTTAESFVMPSSTVTNGFGGAWEYKRGGYSVAVNGNWYARASWDAWGPADALELEPATHL